MPPRPLDRLNPSARTARRCRGGLAFVAGLVLLAAPSPRSEAATATGSMSVSATVLTACTVTPGPLSFGNYDPTSGTAKDATATITVVCTAGTAYTLGLDAGSGAGATTSARKMTLASGSTTLSYAIYSDSGRTANWGNTAGTGALTGTSSLVSLSQNFTAYGRIPVSQTATAGAYTDTVTVTLSY